MRSARLPEAAPNELEDARQDHSYAHARETRSSADERPLLAILRLGMTELWTTMPRVSYRPAIVLTAFAVILAGCSPATPDSGLVRRAVSTFTCCAAHDVNRVYHPGEVLTIHWIRQTTYGLAPSHPAPITLTARLDGAFDSTAQAKATHARAHEQIQARPLRVTDRTTTAPVSRLRIPASAVPGLYNLTTKVDLIGGSTSGTTTIRVARH